MPVWVQALIAIPLTVGLLGLWLVTLGGLWKQEQLRKAPHIAAPPPTSTSAPPATSTARSTMDAVLLVGAGIAIVALTLCGGADTTGIREFAMGGIILAVALQNWRSGRTAAQHEMAEHYPESRPYQDIRGR